MDDFGVKYKGDEHAKHLIATLKEHYTITEDWNGKTYSDISLDWDYYRQQVHLSMPGYCKEALTRFNHKLRKINDQPHKHVIPTYGARIQFATKEDLTPKVDAEKTKFIQQVTGTFIYYARAVDPTMLVALSAIAADQSAPTEMTYEKIVFFLDYVASHPDAILTFKSSNMVLAVHSTATLPT